MAHSGKLWKGTKNPDHLELAQRFYHRQILEPLTQQRDELAGKHTNTKIPEIVEKFTSRHNLFKFQTKTFIRSLLEASFL
jgi:hypothetical protein